MIYDKLRRLEQMVEEGRLTKMRRDYHWRGADVRITDEPEFVHRPRHWLNHDVFVVTAHARELSWLFYELRDAFDDHLDYSNKYGFYDALARRAQRHLEKSASEEQDFRPLLREVLKEGYAFAAMLAENGEIPPNAIIVIHTRDKSGEQLRFEL